MFIHAVAVEPLAWLFPKAGGMLSRHLEATPPHPSPPLGTLGVLCLLLVWASAHNPEEYRAGPG